MVQKSNDNLQFFFFFFFFSVIIMVRLHKIEENQETITKMLRIALAKAGYEDDDDDGEILSNTFLMRAK